MAYDHDDDHDPRSNEEKARAFLAQRRAAASARRPLHEIYAERNAAAIAARGLATPPHEDDADARRDG